MPPLVTFMLRACWAACCPALLEPASCLTPLQAALLPYPLGGSASAALLLPGVALQLIPPTHPPTHPILPPIHRADPRAQGGSSIACFDLDGTLIGLKSGGASKFGPKDAGALEDGSVSGR